MKIGKKLRNKILSSPETKVLNSSSALYFGKKYTYTPITPKEIAQQMNKLFSFCQYAEKSWIYKLFHKFTW